MGGGRFWDGERPMKKRGLLILALAMTVAGVASANVFTPVPRDPAPRASALAMPAPAVARSPVAPVTASVAPAPGAKKPSIEVRQAPVPLLMKARPPVDLPAANAGVDTASLAEPPAKAGEESADNKLGEISAKAAIEADGYKGVRVLRQGVNGIWHARALRGSAEVMLTVDGQGNVTAD